MKSQTASGGKQGKLQGKVHMCNSQLPSSQETNESTHCVVYCSKNVKIVQVTFNKPVIIFDDLT